MHSESTQLSPREREATAFRARGLTVKATAAEMGISASTVKVHLGRVFLKTRCRCTVELVLWFIAHGGPPPGMANHQSPIANGRM